MLKLLLLLKKMGEFEFIKFIKFSGNNKNKKILKNSRKCNKNEFKHRFQNFNHNYNLNPSNLMLYLIFSIALLSQFNSVVTQTIYPAVSHSDTPIGSGSIENTNINTNINTNRDILKSITQRELNNYNNKEDKLIDCNIKCKGCCLNNECVGEGECKFLFFYSISLMIFAYFIIFCTTIYIILITIPVAIQVFRYCNNARKNNKLAEEDI